MAHAQHDWRDRHHGRRPVSDELAAVADAAELLGVVTAQYRQAVRAAYAAGHSLREIAAIAGVSHQTIANLLARED